MTKYAGHFYIKTVAPLLGLLLFAVLILGCGEDATPTATTARRATAAPTSTPRATTAPTATRAPTATATATATPTVPAMMEPVDPRLKVAIPVP